MSIDHKEAFAILTHPSREAYFDFDFLPNQRVKVHYLKSRFTSEGEEFYGIVELPHNQGGGWTLDWQPKDSFTLYMGSYDRNFRTEDDGIATVDGDVLIDLMEYATPDLSDPTDDREPTFNAATSSDLAEVNDLSYRDDLPVGSNHITLNPGGWTRTQESEHTPDGIMCWYCGRTKRMPDFRLGKSRSSSRIVRKCQEAFTRQAIAHTAECRGNHERNVNPGGDGIWIPVPMVRTAMQPKMQPLSQYFYARLTPKEREERRTASLLRRQVEGAWD